MTQSRLNLSVFSNLAFIIQWFREEKPNEATNNKTKKQEANKNKRKQTNKIGEGRVGGGGGGQNATKAEQRACTHCSRVTAHEQSETSKKGSGHVGGFCVSERCYRKITTLKLTASSVGATPVLKRSNLSADVAYLTC